jgi:hypothetical protein
MKRDLTPDERFFLDRFAFAARLISNIDPGNVRAHVCRCIEEEGPRAYCDETKAGLRAAFGG